MLKFDDFDLAVRSLTNGENTVIVDDTGMPSVMVALPQMDSSALGDHMDSHVHPAWLCGSQELKVVYISKFQNIIYNHRAYSLPLQLPATFVSFDEAISVCAQKGAGWGITPAALWSAIALWCKKNQTLPHGNNNFGHDFFSPQETGRGKTFSSLNPKTIYHTATGSGPVTWNHNGASDGICDLNGNVFEWQGGLRLCGGELQIIKNADCMRPEVSSAAGSDDWMAIDQYGNLVAPGSEESLKLDFIKGAWTWIVGSAFQSRVDTAKYCEFKALSHTLNAVPQILKELTLFPADTDTTSYLGEYFYGSNGSKESMLIRGGSFGSQFIAGVFCSGLNTMRDQKSNHIGFRCAYYGSIE